MPVEFNPEFDQSTEPKRAVWRSMHRGVRGKCPSCGAGTVFDRGLLVVNQCGHCGEELHHHRADDLPAYLNIFIIGHVVVAMAILLMDADIVGMWSVVAISCATAIVLSIALMRPLKGMVVGIQWALRMHGFGGDDD